MYLCIFHMKIVKTILRHNQTWKPCHRRRTCVLSGPGLPLFSHQRGIVRRFHATMYGFIRMLAKAAVWAALVRLFNWLMDEFLS